MNQPLYIRKFGELCLLSMRFKLSCNLYTRHSGSIDVSSSIYFTYGKRKEGVEGIENQRGSRKTMGGNSTSILASQDRRVSDDRGTYMETPIVKQNLYTQDI